MSRHESKGQPALPGLELQPALVHLLAPESAGITPADYMDLTDEMLDAAAPNRLKASLINVDRDGRSVLWYRPNRYAADVTVAANPEDYNAIARNVPQLAKAVINKTLQTYPIEVRYDQDKQDAAERSGLHAVETKVKQIDERLETLSRQRELLGIFREMAAPGNQNMSRSYEARAQFNELMRDVIGTMVNAVGNHRNYTTQPMELMRKSIEANLYLHPAAPGPREKYFDELAEAGETYFGHLVILFATRRYEAQKYIREHQ